jgi:hypothetical protein
MTPPLAHRRRPPNRRVSERFEFIADIAHSIMRASDGTAATAIGQALDLIAQMDGSHE